MKIKIKKSLRFFLGEHKVLMSLEGARLMLNVPHPKYISSEHIISAAMKLVLQRMFVLKFA